MRNASGVTGAAPIWHAFMEAVLADPELLAILGAPQDEALWEFMPPESVREQPAPCPAGIRCSAEEYFSAAWLALTEEMGANGDATINTAMRTIYVDRGPGHQPVRRAARRGGVVSSCCACPMGSAACPGWTRRA